MSCQTHYIKNWKFVETGVSEGMYNWNKRLHTFVQQQCRIKIWMNRKNNTIVKHPHEDGCSGYLNRQDEILSFPHEGPVTAHKTSGP